MEKKALYLKVNRNEPFAIKNLSRWIDAAYLMNADCYVICDKVELCQQISDSILMVKNVSFLSSEKCNVMEYIVENISNRNWKNAAYAHLTTFWHAKKNNYNYFWNIDADDTRMCVSMDKMTKILDTVENYAKLNRIDCFSLDMWRSETKGKHWSFGITYVNNNVDWIELFVQRCKDVDYKKLDNEGNQNVDWFFTYLKTLNILKIETFFVENLRFIHYSSDFIEKPIASGLYHWKDGQLIYPFIYYGFGINELGKYEIAKDIIKFDLNVSDSEAQEIFTYYAREGKDISKYYHMNSMINSNLVEYKHQLFWEKHGFSNNNIPEIICFGAGNALEKNIKKIKALYDLKYVCDNDSSKWGKKFVGDVTCISPKELIGRKNIIVIILVYSKNCVCQIEEQLKGMSVEYDYMDNWFLCIE